MTLFGFAFGLSEDRTAQQRPAKDGFRVRDDQGGEGPARWCSIAAQGACVCTGRSFEPGRELTIFGGDVELHGRVLWCRPMSDRKSFVAGIRLLSTNGAAGPITPAYESA